MLHMAAHNGGNPATHFGRQMRKERMARGWTLRELAARTGINFSHLGRIENGHRPPTAAIADACDRVFPERNGWFREYYEDSKSAIPPGLRSWTEHEDKARRLSLWAPGIIHGLLQTEEYARVFLDTLPGVDAEVIRRRRHGPARRLAEEQLQRSKRVVCRSRSGRRDPDQGHDAGKRPRTAHLGRIGRCMG